MNRTVLLSGILGASMVFAANLAQAQVIEITSPDDWKDAKNVTALDGGVQEVGAMKMLLSKKSFKIDTAKTYRISGDFKAAKDPKAMAYLGFFVKDAKGRQVSSYSVGVIAGTDTELVEACTATDTQIKIKDGSKWKNVAYYRIFTNTSEDYSDLPNHNMINIQITEIKQDGDVYVVTLKSAIGKALPAGTKIRQQAGGSYLYSGGARKTTDDWVTLSGTISGIGKSGWNAKVWPVGSDSAEILILANWEGAAKGATTQIRNIKVEEVN